jgi:hypothetical protein
MLENHMVSKLFRNKRPNSDDKVLCFGKNPNSFVNAVTKWCQLHKTEIPQIHNVQLEGVLYDYIVGDSVFFSEWNLGLLTLFFRNMFNSIVNNGRLVCNIPPEILTASDDVVEVRSELFIKEVEEIEFITKGTFSLFNYKPKAPIVICSVINSQKISKTTCIDSDGIISKVNTKDLLKSKMEVKQESGHTLDDICKFIRSGPGTGADSVFVYKTADIDPKLSQFAHCTLSSKNIDFENGVICSEKSILVPYDRHGNLIEFDKLGAFGDFLSDPKRKMKLLNRSCVKNDSWYHFHDKPMLEEILNSKILFSAISYEPHFVIDRTGNIFPRHGLNYIIPCEEVDIDSLLEYLKTEKVQEWFRKNCPFGENGSLRMNVRIVRNLPIPFQFFF